MKREKFKSIFLFFLAIEIFFLIISCTIKSKVVGKWQEIGKTATIEFLKDGSFKAMDNLGMAVSGEYTLLGDGSVRFEIKQQGSSPEIIEGNLSVRECELTISFEQSKEVERYRRVK